MHQTQRKPFFSRFWPSALVNLLAAAALTAIGTLDVLVTPFGEWQIGQPVPTTYRAPLDRPSAIDELLSGLRTLVAAEPPEPVHDRFIVRRGEVYDLGDQYDLNRLLPERKQFDPKRALGVFLFYFLTLTFFIFVLRRAGQHLELRFRAVGSLYFVLILSALLTRLLFDNTSLSAYVAPTALAVLLFAPLVRQTNAFAIHLLAVALIAVLIAFTPGMVLIPLVAGWTIVLLLTPACGATHLLLASLAGAVMGAFTMAGLDLFTPQSFDFRFLPEGDLAGLAGGMLAAGLAAVLLRYPVTLAFGAVPRSKLSALRDLDHPVLRDLAEKAPGTFQHTLAVANMAEKVADDIAADDKLIRVGAYYHDIGKMRQPEYFAENQQGENPHDRLSPEDSVVKLRSHIDDGVTIARGANLPERVVDFIVEHHGRSTMDYFVDKASRAAKKRVDPKRYSYQGRNPTSRETAVLMIVDSVEAASRTLSNPDPDSISELVRQIIFGKLLRGYLDDSGLTTKDLKRIGASLVRYLEAQFHVRIEYPWQRKEAAQVPAANQAAPSAAPLASETSGGNRIVTPISPMPAAEQPTSVERTAPPSAEPATSNPAATDGPAPASNDADDNAGD